MALVFTGSDEYPQLLKHISHPPPLYRLGEPLGARRYVAVVGARDPSPGGAELARLLGRLLAERGFSVVTGLARGVDEAAAEAALEAGGHVVGVAPFLYERNGALWYRARRFLGRLSVVAERLHPSDVRRDLVLRNRIIAGMSELVVIPEARYREEGWGTIHVVKFALEYKRPVLVFKPTSGDAAAEKAFEIFVREGAVPVKNIEEVLALLQHS